MTDRVKLTDSKILRENLEGYIPEELIDQICNVYENYPILNEKAEKWDKHLEMMVKSENCVEQIMEDNTNLKQEIETISDDLGNKLQVKTLEIEGLKQIVDNLRKYLKEEVEAYSECEEIIMKELSQDIKEILGDKK